MRWSSDGSRELATALFANWSHLRGLAQRTTIKSLPLARKEVLKKKTYVHKNYTTHTESTHVNRSQGFVRSLTFVKATEMLFHQWFKLNSTSPSNFNRYLKSTSQVLVAPVTSSNECFNIKALFSRWVNTFHLLFTLFTYRCAVTTFSSAIFADEVNALNYFGSNFNYKLFRYVQPCFYFTEPSYGLSSLLVFTKLLQGNLDVGIITDVNTHDKTLFYLQSINTYTIGLVPTNYNQWTFSYPIPTTLESFLAQYFFLKWLHLTKQLASVESNNWSHTYWRNLLRA